jgi:hypothetical protein
VPTRGRDSINPFDVSVRNASRNTVRLTPNASINSASRGRIESGA